MVELSLTESTWNYEVDDQSGVEDRISSLNKLEIIICSLLLSSGCRSEARLWLCNTISGIKSITPRRQRELFVNLLRSKPLKQGLAAQLLHMIFEKHPQKAGPVIAKKSYKLDSFFKGNSRRILDWFSNFSGSGDVNHQRGARALSQFAFVNRDICWEELEWNGKHGQSPAMVATNPHYFLDLDVHRTVQNFLEYVPEFWSSVEFADSLKDGEIFSLDTDYFVKMFVDLMYEDDLKEIWDVINDFLVEESFSSLCNRLLIILEEKELWVFVDLIREYLNPKMDGSDFTNPSFWIEIVLSKCEGSDSLDQLLLVNAVISQGRQLLRVLNEEGTGEKMKIKNIVSEICNSKNHGSMFTYLMQNCVKTRTLEAIKLLGLNSWALHYVLSEENRSPESWETLFVSNGIGFRKYNEYGFLGNDHFSEESGSDFDEGGSIRVKRKKKKKEKFRKKRKRRRNLDHDDDYDNELLDFDSSNNKLGPKSKICSWLLSTDRYSTSWSSVDLPEHLSRHCFSTWMKWVCAKWTDEV